MVLVEFTAVPTVLYAVSMYTLWMYLLRLSLFWKSCEHGTLQKLRCIRYMRTSGDSARLYSSFTCTYYYRYIMCACIMYMCDPTYVASVKST